MRASTTTIVVLIASLLSGCERLGSGMELVKVESDGRNCTINQSRMPCADVATFLLREDRLSRLSRIVVLSQRGETTQAMAERVASGVRAAGFQRVQVDIDSIYVQVSRDANQCSVNRIPMACGEIVTHLREKMHAPLADPLMVSPYSQEFVSEKTMLVAKQLGEAGYKNVAVVGHFDDTRDSSHGVASN